MLKIKKYLIFFALLTVYGILAMTQVVKKSPALTTSALSAGRNVVKSAPPAARPAAIGRTSSLEIPMSVRYRSTFATPQVTRQAYSQAFKKQLNSLNPTVGKKILEAAARFGEGMVLGSAAVMAARWIADEAPALFNMAIFDQELISDKFSQAIVRIYNSSDYSTEKDYNLEKDFSSIKSQGSAFIVHIEAEQDLYFVITAAHCVPKEYQQIIAIQNLRDPSLKFYVKVVPVIVDNDNDVAVLLIPDALVEEIKRKNGSVPAIPSNQLANFRPYKKEVVTLQGYPGFLSHKEPGFYRKQFVSEGPVMVRPHDDQGSIKDNIPGEFLKAYTKERPLFGVSGSPIIALRDKKPHIIGIASSEDAGSLNASAAGQLPEYVQKAIRIQEEQKDTGGEIKKLS